MLGEHHRTIVELGSGVNHYFYLIPFKRKSPYLTESQTWQLFTEQFFLCTLVSIVVASYDSIYCFKSLQSTLEVPEHCPSVLLLNINFST